MARATKIKVVVDGSNIATEGRTVPSLQQLDEAVSAFLDEFPNSEAIVVVDASFDHRIAATERPKFKAAELAGEIVTTPAGALGRGDAFILKIAARIGAVVLSNDSFQEFHAEHPWLFDEGRLVGGKPVPGVGWIFTARNPVRGAKSVRATKKLAIELPGGVKPTVGTTITPAKTAKAPAKKADAAPAKAPAKRAEAPVKAAKTPTKVAKAPAKKADAPAKATKAPTKATKAPAKKVDAPAKATKAPTKAAKAPVKVETVPVAPAAALRRGRQPVNPEAEFAAFTAAHRTRSHVDGEVVAFSSHGAVIAVEVGEGRRVECYAPTIALGDPPPARARDVLKRGDRRTFRLVNVDKERRIAELALI
jgi:hypothetical protein